MTLLLFFVLLIVAVWLCARKVKWTVDKKRAVIVFVFLGVLLIGSLVNHLFFKEMEFVQSKGNPNLYLVKNPVKESNTLQQGIQQKINKHLQNGYPA